MLAPSPNTEEVGGELGNDRATEPYVRHEEIWAEETVQQCQRQQRGQVVGGPSRGLLTSIYCMAIRQLPSTIA